MEWISDPQIWIALVTLTLLELVLGIDNIIFISILSDKLPENQRDKARFTGIALAMITRILLLFSLSWVIGLTAPLFNVFGKDVSGRDLILIIGGLFLMGKATREIHGKLEGEEENETKKTPASFTSIIIQILLLDLVFSLDSVITAVGMVDQLWVMITAVVISVAFMLFASGAISSFVNRHPTLKMLALSFLLLIGTSLVAEGLHFHIPKGYIYFAMAFSVLVEMFNLGLRKKASPKESQEPAEVEN
ncbi:MAG: TerC family protein [Pyrinomonadaceae bacterium]|nr:TerC family protein [Pyrinomonadaceae bacterium]